MAGPRGRRWVELSNGLLPTPWRGDRIVMSQLQTPRASDDRRSARVPVDSLGEGRPTANGACESPGHNGRGAEPLDGRESAQTSNGGVAEIRWQKFVKGRVTLSLTSAPAAATRTEAGGIPPLLCRSSPTPAFQANRLTAAPIPSILAALTLPRLFLIFSWFGRQHFESSFGHSTVRPSAYRQLFRRHAAAPAIAGAA